MNKVISFIFILTLILKLTSADLQNIQNANPLNVDLSNPSGIGLVNNGDPQINEHKLGGYRPLYPPYFSNTPSEQINNQPQYYDKEYYTRGAQIQDIRFNRQLNNPSDFLVRLINTPRTFGSQQYTPSYAVKYVFDNSDISVKTIYYDKVKFPNE